MQAAGVAAAEVFEDAEAVGVDTQLLAGRDDDGGVLHLRDGRAGDEVAGLEPVEGVDVGVAALTELGPVGGPARRPRRRRVLGLQWVARQP